ncbi:precorrin-6A/cobalt-precorrin-6A reductase [Patescibacteria group bacterium]|nr:precorrin-6A/cobalt-precorrin-6A reductase [Patescibacteria group bacterium]
MILVLSGTEEGKEIVRRLHEEGLDLLTTVATEYGKKMFEQMGLETLCLQGRLDAHGFSQLIKEKGIDTVIDATHPYAIEVSQNAMDACKKTNTRYLRFERQEIEIPTHPLIHKVKTMAEAVDKSRVLGKKIFLTTGISSVAKFILLKDEKELYVRILPVPEHIALCLDMGIPPAHIIAMHGPFSEDLNRAMFKQYHINTMVTKDSGEAGGVLEKIHAALKEGIDTIVIKRPRLEFSQKYSSIDEVVKTVKIQ